MKRTAVMTIRRRLAIFSCFGFGVVMPGVVSAQRDRFASRR